MPTIEEPRRRQFCGHCGKENPIEHRFCGACGAVLAPLDSTAATPAPPAASTITAAADTAAAPDLSATPVAVPMPRPETALRPALETRRVPDVPPIAAAPPAVAPRPPAAPAPPEPTKPALAGVALERERERLLTLVNVQRARGQSAEARATLEQIFELSVGAPARELASTQEMIGDLYSTEEKWEAALEAYARATELDRSQVSAEKKFATLTLRIADMKAERRLADAMMNGGDISGLLAASALDSHRGRRNAGMAMLLSTVVPGFGQMYNGEMVKGCVLVGVFALTLLYSIVSGDLATMVSKFTSALVPQASYTGHGRVATHVSTYSAHSLSTISIIVAVIMIANWLYAIVDAPFMAAKTPKNELGPAIDKSGWEV